MAPVAEVGGRPVPHLDRAGRAFVVARAESLPLGCSGKVQMLCLPEYLPSDQRDLALRTNLAWKSLSNALHVDAGHELTPTSGELATCCNLADELILVVEEQDLTGDHPQASCAGREFPEV